MNKHPVLHTPLCDMLCVEYPVMLPAWERPEVIRLRQPFPMLEAWGCWGPPSWIRIN